MKTLYALLLGLSLIGCSNDTPGVSYRGNVVQGPHPVVMELFELNQQQKFGNIVTIDSGGGNTFQWRLAVSMTQAPWVGMVRLTGECSSACLLYAISVANKGIPVYLVNVEYLRWHRISGPKGTLNDQEMKAEMDAWKAVGLPEWAIQAELEVQKGINTIDGLRQMENYEINLAGFRVNE